MRRVSSFYPLPEIQTEIKYSCFPAKHPKRNLFCMLIKSKFRPAWWLPGAHAQTLWAAKVHPAPWPQTRRERIETLDGDFLDLDWSTGRAANREKGGSPLVVLFHGLTGSVKSPYIRSIMASLDEAGIRSVLMHFRGCSGEPNRTAGSYHSGHIADIEFVIDEVSSRSPDETIMAVGYSLGGNALLKYLAQRPDNPLEFAVSVCPPLVLAEGARRLGSGFSRLYQRMLIKELKAAVRTKDQRYPELKLGKLNYEDVTNFVEFDDQITAPLHGYASGQDYYDRASTLSDLRNVETPTHVIFSRNDPFFSQRCVPADDTCMSAKVTFELVQRGGHVAFISGNIPFAGHDWLGGRITQLIRQQRGQ